MKNNKVRNLAEFRRWVKIRLVEKEISQNELARQMGIPHARISEATHGKQSGNKYIIPDNIYVDNGREFLTFDIGGLGHRKKKPKDGEEKFEPHPGGLVYHCGGKVWKGKQIR